MRFESGFPIAGRCAAGVSDLLPGNPGIYRSRGLPLWTLNATLVGKGCFRCRHQTLFTEPGDLVLVLPQAVNDYGSRDPAQRWKHSWCLFHPEKAWYRLLDWPEVHPGLRFLRPHNPTVRKKITATFKELIAVAQSPWPQRDDLTMSLLHTLLWWCDTANQNPDRHRIDERLQSALEFLVEHHARPLSVEGLARIAGMSPSRFAHLFRQQLGITPMRYLERHRIERACERLLTTSLPIHLIAAEVGYEDAAYFNRVFKRQTRMTPRAYRRRSAE